MRANRQPNAVLNKSKKSKTIVDVLKIPENAIAGHLNWGTFTLRDVVTKSGGASPIGNDTVKYRGSSNDAALNAGVLRFKADPQASARFGLGQSGHQAHACRHRRTLRGLCGLHKLLSAGIRRPTPHSHWPPVLLRVD